MKRVFNGPVVGRLGKPAVEVANNLRLARNSGVFEPEVPGGLEKS